MEKSKKRLIFFMPSMEGGGVEKNLIIIANYISRYIDNVELITFDILPTLPLSFPTLTITSSPFLYFFIIIIPQELSLRFSSYFSF